MQYPHHDEVITLSSSLRPHQVEKGVSLVVQWQRICLQCGRCWLDPWVRKIPLEKEIATHSSILTWEIPWTDEPSRLEPVGLQRVGHNLVTENTCRQVEKGEQTRSF